MVKVYVIAPDIYSGEAFNKVLNRHGIETEFHFHKIRPRVIENKITTSKDVLDDMNSIFETFQDKTKSVVIACNTLQLWLDDVKEEYKRNVKIYTTFEACEWKFKNDKNKPLWLGTTPLVRVTKKFPTLASLNNEVGQELVQELIWRVKMYGGDDIQTAPERVKSDCLTSKKYQKIKINKLKNEIFEIIKKYNIKNVITGCTELPLIFDKKNENGITFYDPAEVLAEYIKSQSVSIIFCGGTISSVANNQGLRISGKAFNLLEKLAEIMPGSYKTLNITKSNIVYDGFSENMTDKIREELVKTVVKNIDDGMSRIVITHGTDSMEHTARYLEKRLGKKIKDTKTVIVLTGSNDHAGSKVTDAWSNLKDAINVNKEHRIGGVFVAFHGQFIPASDVAKEFFDGKQMNYVSNKTLKYRFDLKKYNLWKESKKQIIRDRYLKNIKNPTILEYEVNKTHNNHNDLISKIEINKPNAMLFILYHSSTANISDKNSSVSDLIKKISKMNIPCFGITENGDPTDLSKYPSSVELKESGLIAL